MEDKGWRRWDWRGHAEDQAPLVEEGLVAALCEPGVLRRGGSDGIVRGWGENEEKGHLAHRENDTPAI